MLHQINIKLIYTNQRIIVFITVLLLLTLSQKDPSQNRGDACCGFDK